MKQINQGGPGIAMLVLSLLSASPALALGGEATGLTSTGVICRNSSSGQLVRSSDGLLTWDCAALGLKFSPGDRILLSVRGFLPVPGLSQPAGAEIVDFVSHLISDPEMETSFLDLGDLDNDGDPDVLVYSPFRWFENVGMPSMNFAEHRFDEAANLRAAHVIPFDVDGDGALDVVSALELPSPDGLVWWENQGDRPVTFVQHPIDFREGWEIRLSFPGDLNADGKTDFFAFMKDLSPANTVEIFWLESLGKDSYQRNLILTRPNSLASLGLRSFDADADGDLDLVLVDAREDEVYWLENEGPSDPAFTTSHLIDPGYPDPDGTPRIGDLDGDGDDDLVVFLDDIEHEVRWYEHVGEGAYVVHSLGQFPDDEDHAIAVGDFSADGRLDIAFGGGVRWLENQGGSPLSFAEHPPTATETRNFVVPGDMDLDGRVDLMGAPAEALLWQENVIGLRLSATGLAVQGYLCRNRSSGQTVRVESAATTVDCEVEGLVVEPGDEIEVFARGMAE